MLVPPMITRCDSPHPQQFVPTDTTTHLHTIMRAGAGVFYQETWLKAEYVPLLEDILIIQFIYQGQVLNDQYMRKINPLKSKCCN